MDLNVVIIKIKNQLIGFFFPFYFHDFGSRVFVHQHIIHVGGIGFSG
jgi:hypothetical protein